MFSLHFVEVSTHGGLLGGGGVGEDEGGGVVGEDEGGGGVGDDEGGGGVGDDSQPPPSPLPLSSWFAASHSV